MSNQTNPNPLVEPVLLEHKRGKLRIYFGYAAGVGKTCAMLSDARDAKKDGVDVVAGYIEPHARPETTALLEGLEVLPSLEIDYKGVRLRELDLDRSLSRKPELILVDELAHTNAEGCRHKSGIRTWRSFYRQGSTSTLPLTSSTSKA